MHKNKILKTLALVTIFTFVFTGVSILIDSNIVYADSTGGLGGNGGCCGGGPEGPAEPDGPDPIIPPIVPPIIPPVLNTPTCAMSANPGTIDSGDNSTLAWVTTNVVSASIDNGIGNVAVNDSILVSPNTTTLYTGTFVGNNGSTIYCNAQVTVIETPPIAPTCSLNIDPNSIQSGQSSELSWTSTGADSGNIDNGIGDVGTDGTTTISPTENTTYTGTFTGSGGSVTCSDTITVNNGGGGCTVNCGGGGNNPPNVSLRSSGFEVNPEPSYVYLSQVPYTGFLDFLFGKVKVILFESRQFIMAN